MTQTPIYVQKVQLTDTQTNKHLHEINLTTAEGQIPNWTIIHGNNLSDNSDLLQYLAWSIPTALTGQLLAEKFPPAAPKTAAGLQITTTLSSSQQLHQSKPEKSTLATATLTLAPNPVGRLAPATSITTTGTAVQKAKPVLFTYNADTRFGKNNIERHTGEKSIPNLKTKPTELVDPEQVLKLLYLTQPGGTRADSKNTKQLITELKAIITDLLPHQQKPAMIRRETNDERPGLSTASIIITSEDQKKYPLSAYSPSHKAIIHFVLDLAWKMILQHTVSPRPLQEAAIVLIDQLDQYLPPDDARQTLQKLSTYFPNIQFIATTEHHDTLNKNNGNYLVIQYNR